MFQTNYRRVRSTLRSKKNDSKKYLIEPFINSLFRNELGVSICINETENSFWLKTQEVFLHQPTLSRVKKLWSIFQII